MKGEAGCTPGAQPTPEDQDENPESADLQAKFDAGGGTRTPDTRIMIGVNC
jgi:hypothetical protein